MAETQEEFLAWEYSTRDVVHMTEDMNKKAKEGYTPYHVITLNTYSVLVIYRR